MQSSTSLPFARRQSRFTAENDFSLADSSESTRGLYEVSIGTLKRVSGRLTQLLIGRRTTKPPTGAKVLIVEDEETICFSMGEYFRQHGFDVDIALDAEHAEDLLLENKYDVLIQDLRLGLNRQTDGLDLIRLTHSRSPDTRIVVLTAYATAEAEREARNSGADVFLTKPKPLSQVAQVVQALMDSPRRKTRVHTKAG